MSKFRMIVTAAIATAGLTIGAAPAIAAVAQTHAQHPAIARMATSGRVQRHVSQVMIPDSRCPRGGTEVTIYKSGCTDAKGLDTSCKATSGKMPYNPAYAFNGCGHRLWLFTGDLTGTSVCISPGTGNDGAFGPKYNYYQVTNNPDICS